MAEITLESLAGAKSAVAETHNEMVKADVAQLQQVEYTPEERKQIDEIKNGIDFMDTQSTVQYGIGAQRQLTEFADSILTKVKSKDGGEVGELLSDLVIEVKSLDAGKLGGEGLVDKLPIVKNAAHSLKKLKERYTKAEVQIDRIEAALERARMDMLKDIGMFDIMYQQNLKCFKELGLYIQAGKEKVQEIKEVTIPKLRGEAETSGDPMNAQLVQDFEATVDRFEKKYMISNLAEPLPFNLHHRLS